MPQFTSSAKPIQYFCETTLINKFGQLKGDRFRAKDAIVFLCLAAAG